MVEDDKNKIIHIMKKSWRDVTIDEYFNLVDRLSDEGLTEYEREVILVSFVTGLDED